MPPIMYITPNPRLPTPNLQLNQYHVEQGVLCKEFHMQRSKFKDNFIFRNIKIINH